MVDRDSEEYKCFFLRSRQAKDSLDVEGPIGIQNGSFSDSRLIGSGDAAIGSSLPPRLPDNLGRLLPFAMAFFDLDRMCKSSQLPGKA